MKRMQTNAMVGKSVVREAVSCCVAVMLGLALSGCVAAKVAGGKDGADMSAITIGSARADVEARLGEPIRHWRGDSVVSYAVYEFDKGVPARPGRAAAVVAVDVLLLGLLEVMFVDAKDEQIYGPSVRARVLVSYDKKARVIGLFNEFDKLPPDGRSHRRPAVLTGAADDSDAAAGSDR